MNDKDVPTDFSNSSPTITRRTVLQKAALAGITLAVTGSTAPVATASLNSSSSARSKPNILFVIVDQLRKPRWFPNQSTIDSYLPNLARIRTGAVSFDKHYTAATACTPSRGVLLTGIYTHQIGLFNTLNGPSDPWLNSGFLTWGHALRDHGYATNWFGKWHLSEAHSLEPYGFDGGTYPSPDGNFQEGTHRDPHSTTQFLEWFDNNAERGPWATTISLLNPHDICYAPKWTTEYFTENPPKQIIKALPANFETPEDLVAHKKPRAHIGFQVATDALWGAIPYDGDGFEDGWHAYLDEYIAYQQLVDTQIGRVLDALDKRPEIEENTIIIFTSDHGEYGGSHGLRTKGGTGYEESINVPLYIKDPTGRLASSPEILRTSLTSTVDIFPLLLTIANGGDSWRGNPSYSHIADRADIASILRHPRAPGRPYILHTTDESGGNVFKHTASAFGTIADELGNIPHHVINVRTHEAKYGMYSHWTEGTSKIESDDQDCELYDYSTPNGRNELINQAEDRPDLASKLNKALTEHLIPNELRRPLPKKFQTAQEEAYHQWFAEQAS